MTKDDLEKFGIDYVAVTKHYQKLSQLAATSPAIICCRAVKHFSYQIGSQTIKRWMHGQEKVMSAHMYNLLEFDMAGAKCLEPSSTKFTDVYKPYKGEDLTGKTIMVFRTGGIGDLLFIQPNLRYLKLKYPTCKIVFGCAYEFFSIIKCWSGCIDELFHFPVLLDTFKQADYHVFFEGVIERVEESKNLNAYSTFSKWMGLNLPESILFPRLCTQKSTNENVKRHLEDLKVKEKDFICCQIRASSPIRTPSTQIWKKIFKPLLEDGHKLIITDKPSVADKIDDFIKLTVEPKFRHRVFNFAPRSRNIGTSVSLASMSKLVLAPDSSMIHIAAGLGVPCFGVYASFPAETRLSTYKNCDWIQPEEDDFDICSYGGRFCCIHGHKPCPFHVEGIVPCFMRVNTKKAYEKIKNLLINGAKDGS